MFSLHDRKMLNFKAQSAEADGLLLDLLQNCYREAADLAARLQEDALRIMLGQWVSGVEPSALYQERWGEPDELLGLTAVGHWVPYVLAPFSCRVQLVYDR